MTFLRLFLFVACVVALAQAFGNGAPKGACSTLLPKHANSTNILGSNPQYRLEVPAQVTRDQQTQIILRGANFKGFIVRAQNVKSASGGGYFKQGTNSKPLSCDGEGDAATHDNPSPKTEVILDWVAPAQPGIYTVKATIVEEHSTYYTGYSKEVTVQ